MEKTRLDFPVYIRGDPDGRLEETTARESCDDVAFQPKTEMDGSSFSFDSRNHAKQVFFLNRPIQHPVWIIVAL